MQKNEILHNLYIRLISFVHFNQRIDINPEFQKNLFFLDKSARIW